MTEKDFFGLTVNHARSEQRRLVPTHCTVDAPPNGRLRLSACDRQVLAIEIDEQAPTCPECAAALAARRADTRTADEVFGEANPSLAVKPTHFNPTAGYVPRWRF